MNKKYASIAREIYEQISDSRFEKIEFVFNQKKREFFYLIKQLRKIKKNFCYFDEALQKGSGFAKILNLAKLVNIFVNVEISTDGNCFYRGFLFTLFESMVIDKELY